MGFDIPSLHVPLREDDPGRMFHQTDRVHRVTGFLFKFQSSPLRFAINGHGTGSSFLLVLLKQVHKQLTKSRFYLLYIQFAKQALDRGLMGRDSFLKSQRLFDLLTLSGSPLGYGQL